MGSSPDGQLAPVDEGACRVKEVVEAASRLEGVQAQGTEPAWWPSDK